MMISQENHHKNEDSVSLDMDINLKKFSDIDTQTYLAEITLDDSGIIKSCSSAVAELLGCTVSSLLMRHVSNILPQLGDVILIEGDRVNPYLRFLSRADHHFEVIAFGGARFLSALFFNEIEDLGRHCMRIIFRPIPAFQ